VLRYAGFLDEAAARCEAALARDPTDRRFRSCAVGFIRQGRYGRARDFLRLDGDSEFAAAYEAHILVREGNPQAALGALRKLPDNYAIHGELLLRSCLERRAPSEIAAISNQIQSAADAERDPEQVYFAATSAAACGRAEQAIQLLHQASNWNYCSYPSLMTDPLVASIKDRPDFAAATSAAKVCRERFESYRRQHDATR
jgi:hypothetical protein